LQLALVCTYLVPQITLVREQVVVIALPLLFALLHNLFNVLEFALLEAQQIETAIVQAQLLRHEDVIDIAFILGWEEDADLASLVA